MTTTPINYASLPTEMLHRRSSHLDRLPVLQILRLMSREDERACDQVRRNLKTIAQAADMVRETLAQKGRLFFIGAGTSGRLGALEAAECPPTFHTKPDRIQAVIAGGRKTLIHAQEGAEDSADAGKIQIKRKIRPGDLAIGIAASGVTPFVQGALLGAKRKGAKTILLTCNPLPAKKINALKLDLAIMLNTGPEVIAGSTRLKAATATKLALNMMTTAAMVRLGKTFGSSMVDLRIGSRKLKERAIYLTQTHARVNRQQALAALRRARGHVKTAILMLRQNLSYAQAVGKLKRHHGFLRKALHE
ncbi:MAG: N-acetylmuramic acid 6-phosphate etherase [Elusimicrobia bacterium]|nr:N-acetylmuramic acid 6-phosphate etherase [Elusimicrobiota bacterium]